LCRADTPFASSGQALSAAFDLILTPQKSSKRPFLTV
jgi:hypothetical protein